MLRQAATPSAPVATAPKAAAVAFKPVEVEPAPPTTPKLKEAKSVPRTTKPEPEPEPAPEPEPEPITEPDTKATSAAKRPKTGRQPLSPDIWPQVIEALKRKHNTLYGVIRMARPEFDGDTLTLKFAFAFHQKRLAEKNNRQALTGIINEITGQPVQIECVLDPTVKPAKAQAAPKTATEPAKTPEELKAISNIFGGGELLES